MNPKSTRDEFKHFDDVLLHLDSFPVGAVWRAMIGFAVVPTMSFIKIQDHTGLLLLPFLLGFLLAIRVALAIVRKVVPVSTAVKRVWAERRQVAKRYDSVQWAKLFWIGLGLFSYALFSQELSFPRLIVTLLCLLSGAIGLIRWRVVSSKRESVREPANPTRILV